MELYSLDKLITEARHLAAEYRKATGKPLGISAEIARHDAARLLGLKLVQEQAALGYDAIGEGRWEGKHIQIKGRAIFDETKGGQRIGQLQAEKQWDSLVLVIMDENFEPVEIYEAEREDILESISKSKSRRGAISVAKFKIIGQLVWTQENGLEDGGYWDNRGGVDEDYG